jgi:hypothetical protein
MDKCHKVCSFAQIRLRFKQLLLNNFSSIEWEAFAAIILPAHVDMTYTDRQTDIPPPSLSTNFFSRTLVYYMQGGRCPVPVRNTFQRCQICILKSTSTLCYIPIEVGKAPRG